MRDRLAGAIRDATTLLTSESRREQPWAEASARMAGALGLGAVEVHATDEARRITEAENANGVAVGCAVHLHPARVRPDTTAGREVLAHELVHLAQAQLPLNADHGRAAAEREAAALAPAVARGEPARPLYRIDLARVAADTHAEATPSTEYPIGTVTGREYLIVGGNPGRLIEAIVVQVDALELPQLHARLSWCDTGRFRQRLHELLVSWLHSAGDNLPDWLVSITHPRRILAAVDEARVTVGSLPKSGVPVGPDRWQRSVGVTIADAIAAAITESVQRLGPRYVALGDDSETLRADDGRPLVRYDMLRTSHPMDRFVGRALCGPSGSACWQPAIVRFTPGRRKQAGADASAEAPRRIQITWLGSTDPTLWNWLRAEPADASLEEVAAELYGDLTDANGRTYFGEDASFNAIWLTKAPPYFCVHPNQARVFHGAEDYRPSSEAPVSLDARDDGSMPAMARTALGDEVARAQAGDIAIVPPSGTSSAQWITQAVADSAKLLEYLAGQLAPWSLAERLQPASEFLSRYGAALATADAANKTSWGRTVLGQRDNLQRIAADVTGVVSQLAGSGATHTGPIADLLADYARAAAVAHLVDTATELIARARHRQALVASEAVFAAVRGSGAAVDDMATATDAADAALAAGAIRNSFDPDRDELRADRAAWTDEQAKLEADARALRAATLAGKPIDANGAEELVLHSEEVGFRATLRAFALQVRQVERLAEQADDGAAAKCVDWVSRRMPNLLAGLQRLRTGTWSAERALDTKLQVDALDKTMPPDEYAAAVREVRRDALVDARGTFAALGRSDDNARFLRDAYEVIADQEFRVAALHVAAMIGVSIIAAGAGTLIGDAAEFVLGASRAARVVAGVANLATEAAVNTGGQAMISGQLSGWDFIENFLSGAAASALLRPFHAGASAATEVDEAMMKRWSVRSGGHLVLAKTVEITAEGVVNIATSYMAHRATNWMRGRSEPPSEKQLRDWLLDGAAIGTGRFVHGQIKRMQHRLGGLLELHAEGVAELDAEAAAIATEAAALEHHPDDDKAIALMTRSRALADGEVELLRRLDAVDSSVVRNRAAIARRQAKAEIEASTADLAGLRFSQSGLREIVPGALYEGPPEVVRALVSDSEMFGVSASRDPARKRWTFQYGERVISVDETLGPSHPDHGDTASVHAAAERASLVVAHTVGDVRAVGKTEYEVGSGDATVKVVVRTARTRHRVRARETAHGIELTISDRLPPEAVEGVLAGELARIGHAARRRAAGKPGDGPDALGERGDGTVLSANDVGNIARLRVMRRQLRDAEQAGESGEARRKAMAAKLEAFEADLGLVGESDAAQHRRRLVDVECVVEDDRGRRAAATKAAAGPDGHAGIDLHDHFLGVVDVEVFRAKAAIARDGTDTGSWVPVLEALAAMKQYKHKRTPDGTIIERSVAGDAFDVVAAANDQVKNLTKRDARLKPEEKQKLANHAEAIAADAVRAALTATEDTDFNSAYELRDELIKTTFADPGGTTDDPAVRAQAGYEAYVREALLQLAAHHITYTEQSNSVKKLADRFSAATIRKVHDQLVAEGKLAAGQVDLRFLAMIATSHFGTPDRPNPEDEVPARSDDAAYEQAVTGAIAQMKRGDTVGLDIAGMETFRFDELGKTRFEKLYREMLATARELGQPLVLRPHVGEGAVDARTGEAWSRDAHPISASGEPTHYDRARDNVEVLLDALDELVAAGDLDATLVIVRFGHGTHATPAQVERMVRLGVMPEVNLASNVRTGSLDQTQRRGDGHAEPREQYDDHALPTMIFSGATVILATDGGAVMSTALPDEHHRAEQIIEEVLAGERPIRVTATAAGTRGAAVPDRPDERLLYVTDLTAAELGRFLTAGEKLHADAIAYRDRRPKPQSAQIGAPTAAHWVDLARENGLLATAGTSELSGSKADADRAAAAMRARGDLVQEEPLFDGGVCYHVTSADGATVVDLVGWADAPADYLPDPDPADPQAPQSKPEIRAWYKAEVRKIAGLDQGWQADGLSLEARARRAYEIRDRARHEARAMMKSKAQVVGLEVRDTTVHGTPDPSFELLVNKYMANGITRDEAYETIIGSAQRSSAAYDRRNGIEEGAGS